jgi:hypothetical protein
MYVANDVVEFGGSSYVAIAANTNAPPDVNPLFWDLMASEGDAAPAETKVRKTASESVVNSTTLQDDDQLRFTIAAGESWAFEMMVIATCPASNNRDIKIAFTVPAGATIRWGASGPTVAVKAGSLLGDSGNYAVATGPGPLVYGVANGAVPTFIHITGVVVAGGSGGDVRMQWAQNSNGTQPVIVEQNSYLRTSKF